MARKGERRQVRHRREVQRGTISHPVVAILDLIISDELLLFGLQINAAEEDGFKRFPKRWFEFDALN